MDITEKVELVCAPPTEEVVTKEDLINIFETNDSPNHYIGLEISGFLHLGSLLSTGYKINDFARAGIRCTVFLADWHTMINDKLGGSWETISKVTQYYRDAFALVCPSAQIVLGTDLYKEHTDYWQKLVMFTKHMSLARTMRTLTIMGRSADEETIGLAKLLYPPMQAVDIHTLDVDIAHAGMDQRKIHMLVRDTFPKMGWKVPVAIHHDLLPGLGRPAEAGSQATKMSKSDLNSGIFMHDTDSEVRRKINKAWCEERGVQNNPLLAIARTIIFHELGEVRVERPAKYGGNVSYFEYGDMELDFEAGRLHPGDLKRTIGEYLIRVMTPIREKLSMEPELYKAISKGR